MACTLSHRLTAPDSAGTPPGGPALLIVLLIAAQIWAALLVQQHPRAFRAPRPNGRAPVARLLRRLEDF